MLVDALLVLVIALSVYIGRKSGFLRRFWATIGFFGGFLVGRWLQPHALGLVSGVEDRAVMTVVVLLTSALIGLTIGEYIGVHFKRRLPGKKLDSLDNILGSLVSIMAILIGVWLLASVSGSLPYKNLNGAIRSSHIIAGLNSVLPPAPGVITSLGRLINPNGFPDVFIGNDPIPRGRVNLPALGELSSAVNQAKDSVVRIRSQGCGGIVSGSGFVIDEGLIATNAHVVAGIDRPYVQDANGTHRSSVIWFDPALDFAVLRTSGLAGGKLTFATELAATGTPAAVLGYPGGGDFNAGPAAVQAAFKAKGRDIYNQGHTIRDIYELQAEIVEGDSGGPLIGKDGRVLGVIFAESTTYDQVGYALTNGPVTSAIAEAKARNKTVDTGRCAR